MKIINKKTKEIFVILGFFPDMPNGYCVIANAKSKEIKILILRELIKDYELKEA